MADLFNYYYFYFLFFFLENAKEKKKMNLKFDSLYVLLLKFIYFNSDAQRFSPNLGRLVSPKLCEIALAK